MDILSFYSTPSPPSAPLPTPGHNGNRNLIYPRTLDGAVAVPSTLHHTNGSMRLGSHFSAPTFPSPMDAARMMPLRLAMIVQSRPFLNSGVTRSNNSYPDLSHVLRGPAPPSRASEGDILQTLHRETNERLRQSGNLIDLGTRKKIDDVNVFDPLRPFSESSDSSGGGSPYIGGGDFKNWYCLITATFQSIVSCLID